MTEPLDRNKTDLTHFITACAIGYLADRGFKPIETEVAVADGWIADVASFCYPTQTETKKLGLKIKPRVIIDSDYGEICFIYGHLLTAMVEVKTTKADFRKDLITKFSSKIYPGHLCYLAYPKGLLEPKELPDGWVGLEVSPAERVVKKIWNWHMVHPQHPGNVADFIAQIAIRRDHRTRYAANRAWMKMYRAKCGDS